MDDYKKYVYERNPKVYKYADAGNLATRRNLRKNLECESFDWYMHYVAEDVLQHFPPVEPPPLAAGSIRNVGFPDLCIHAQYRYGYAPLVLLRCRGNLTHPAERQNWYLTSKNEIRLKQSNDCMEVHGSKHNVSIWLYRCHSMGGNQYWKYNVKLKWLQLGSWGVCLEAAKAGGVEQGRIEMQPCMKYRKRQKWNFSDAALNKILTVTQVLGSK